MSRTGKDNCRLITEQFVGQELLAHSSPYQDNKLFYWERQKAGSDVEVDFLYVYKEHILPIEVKAGSTGRLKSLHAFMKDKKVPIGIRVSQNPLSFEDGILSAPFYRLGKLPLLLDRHLA